MKRKRKAYSSYSMPTPKGVVTQQDIADRAGVHITTVSLALRDNPRLPPATRKRIQDLAEEMGYRPDPMLSALTVYRKRLKRARHQGVLAWLCPCVKEGGSVPSSTQYRCGAVERGQELGYQIEDFSIAELGRFRLSRVLRARNIQGLLIPPQSFNRTHINFDWENFSAVCFGFSVARPRLHLVTNAQYQSTRTAMRELRVRGYRRIGFVTTHNIDERTNLNFSSGFLSEQRRFKPSDQIPMLILNDSTIPAECEEFGRWYGEHRPEVILALYRTVPELMRRLNIGYGECGYASLDADLDGNESGICQNYPLLGRTAVDFLVKMIQNNERGIPAERTQLLIEGVWVDGKTIRTKAGYRAGS